MIHQFTLFTSKDEIKLTRAYSSTILSPHQITTLLRTEKFDCFFVKITSEAKHILKRYNKSGMLVLVTTSLDENEFLVLELMDMFILSMSEAIFKKVNFEGKHMIKDIDRILMCNFDFVLRLVDAFIVDGKVLVTSVDDIVERANIQSKISF
ncbi:hypothetical protein EDEG_02221 [Edhazardia aedis USNM 41457]|uniref:Coatomer subunit zeta n=1 Tax=Edhazardia aedis (strain USNM 41457) TaxID=1003232 RepID=J9D6P4_EDHAE|nr:hypothetical protein EDEG_02221 [Edhazardia aedis USNM 41457]|eukprot:EJW03456.1 hypothetical protein EDEG_02221 [Edhazardia aedis USNM 41457]